MDLTFLGTGAAFNPEMDNSNAFFTIENEFFLIDCGESTFAKLWNLPQVIESRKINVIITHLHCDHVGSLGSLISFCRFVLQKPVQVVHPLKTIVSLLDLMGIEQDSYHWEPFYAGNKNVSFEPIEVEHVSNMRCFGYIIKTTSDCLYYSGDAKRIPELVLEQFREGKIKKIFQDTSIDITEHPTHGNLSDLEQQFSSTERSRVYCIHLDRDFRQVIKEKGFQYPYVL